jgi:hypothetical protein
MRNGYHLTRRQIELVQGLVHLFDDQHTSERASEDKPCVRISSYNAARNTRTCLTSSGRLLC